MGRKEKFILWNSEFYLDFILLLFVVVVGTRQKGNRFLDIGQRTNTMGSNF
jgi:hypothetical protein